MQQKRSLSDPEMDSMAWNGHQAKASRAAVMWVMALAWLLPLVRCGLLLYLTLLINFAAFLYRFTARAPDFLSGLACLLWRGLA